MKADIKALWLEALRSGEYAQTTGMLRRAQDEPEDDAKAGFCCLGVLCDLAEKAGVTKFQPNEVRVGMYGYETTISGGYANKDDEDTYYRDNEMLPEYVQEWAGLNASNPEVWHNESMTALAELNDDAGLNFSEIADAIDNADF
jgi:hypothetical protein